MIALIRRKDYPRPTEFSDGQLFSNISQTSQMSWLNFNWWWISCDGVVRGQLVHSASLLQLEENGNGSVCEMHSLIHQFVTLETRADEACFEDTLMKAIKAFHAHGAHALFSTGDSFSSPSSDHCSQRTRTTLPHVIKALIPLCSAAMQESVSL